MSSAQSMYLVKSSDLDAIKREFDDAEPAASSAWVRCGLRTGVGPPNDDVLCGDKSLAASWAEKFDEVIFLYGDTSTDGFVYEHARDGELVRKLVWFPMLDEDWTPGWICVEGEPEPWEADLFGDKKLESFLEFERERYDDEGRAEEFEGYASQVREDWKSGRIKANRTYPACDATVTRLVERYYGTEQSR